MQQEKLRIDKDLAEIDNQQGDMLAVIKNLKNELLKHTDNQSQIINAGTDV